jgi:hypothetical protein
MTTTTPDDTKTIRFRLLGDLALALSSLGCSNQVVLPALGSAVLYVDRRDRQTKLGIGTVEHDHRWVYTWSGRWASVHALDQVAQHIAQEVLA